jgi:hypothetical protein
MTGLPNAFTRWPGFAGPKAKAELGLWHMRF